MNDSGNRGRDGLAAAATICLLVCVVVLIVSIVGVMRTPVGPAGDPDATDGRWQAMFGCFPFYFLAVASGLVLPFAVGVRRERLGVAVATVLGVSAAVGVAVLVMVKA